MDPNKDAQEKQTTVLLIRHAQNEWVQAGRLAGRIPGVRLNDQGQAQAAQLGEFLSSCAIQALYSSPLERAQETASAVAVRCGLPVETSEGIGEVDFGTWAGRTLESLKKEPVWRLVQFRPSHMRFPGGESIREVQLRAVDEIERLVAAHLGRTIVAVSHADVIKVVLGHYLGLHLDQFQKLVVSPASISRLVFSEWGGFVWSCNETGHLPPDPGS